MGEIPIKVLNRLRLGRDIASLAEPRSPNNRAFVIIVPIVSLLRLELSLETIEQIRDDDLPSSKVIAEKISVAQESDLHEAVSRWLSDPATLRHPGDVPDCTLVQVRYHRIEVGKHKSEGDL